jgi:glycosyltransferase involved in cell wall biosynthesis
VKIGYLIPEFPSQTHVFFWREVRTLRDWGVDLRLISTRRPDPGACRHEFAAAAARETHYVFPPRASALASWSLDGFTGAAACERYLRRLERAQPLKRRMRSYGLLPSAVDLARFARRERLQHIHVQSCADAAHVAALCQLLGGPRYSLTLHGDLHVYGADHDAKMRRAAFVSAVGTHLLRQIVEQTSLPASRVHVTCMGVRTDELARLGTQRTFVSGRLRLLTVARLHPMKGHFHALAALKTALDQGLDLHYTIAGEGPYRPEIEARIRQLGLSDRVTLAGTLSEPEVFNLLAKADAFVLPSIGAGEAWPVSVMEAMASGLPVICSIIGATPEMIVSGEDGLLVEQADEAGLAQAMIALGRDEQQRQRLGENARLTAQRRFDVQVTARRLLDAIEAAATAA